MRTLKKSLALVLALVMVLGLGVIGASADNALDNYTDASEIGDAYYEAVGVLTGLGIIDGMTETTIEPTGTYTREQAAKIIATMVLGVKNAESLTCVEAPFDDVPADRWSAGYIAFCVEQGIIDGMTDTTFEPTGTLTGFQWAKMLLAAVGFGANGEFTGTSWSLNTARVAHEAGLFTGDLSGADHVNLSRQQAALYAFNTLTEIKQVSYSANNDNYIYGLAGYELLNLFGSWWADGTGHTLAETVFSLTSDEGIITDNEGMGNKTTDLSSSYSDTADIAKINADTDAYMMFHGARIWYVIGGTRNNPTTEAVFVYDLAKTTTLECPDEDAREDLVEDIKASDLKETLTVGDTGRDYYEYALVDNSAVDLPSDTKNYVTVNYKLYMTKLGARSTNNETTKIGATAVDNDDIWTDISEISKNKDIIVLKAGTEYYVYAVGATSGAVVRYDSNGTITLSDGTKLTPSVFCDYTVNTAVVQELVSALKNKPATSPNYGFSLDTHGHYITFSNDAFKTVAYYTTAWKNPNYSENWSTDQEYIAQFVDVATGDVEEIPVTADWEAWAQAGGYYDITDELYGNETYAPEQVFVSDTTYGDYGYVAKTEVFKAGVHKVGDYYFNDDTVTFVIVSGAGDSIDVDIWTGIDGLLAGYAEKYDLDTNAVKAVSLSKMAVLTSDNTGNNDSVSVIFAYDESRYVTGGIAFFPKDVTGWSAVDNDYVNVMAYLNGAKVDKDIPVSADDYNKGIKAGFYSYTIDDTTGLYSLTPLNASEWGLILDESDIREADGKYWIEANGDDYDLAADTPVIDLRTKPESDINSVEELADTDFNDAFASLAEVAYVVNSDNEVLYIYLVDANVYTLTVKFAQEGDTLPADTTLIKGMPTSDMKVKVSVWNIQDDDGMAGVTFLTDETTLDFAADPGYELVYTEGGATKTVAATSSNGSDVTFYLPVTADTVITVCGFTAKA